MAIMNTALRDAADAYRGRPASGATVPDAPGPEVTTPGTTERGARQPRGPASGQRAAVRAPTVQGPASGQRAAAPPPEGPARRPATAVTAHPSEGWKPEGDWKLHAECGPGDTELFFSKDPMEKRAALAICHDCPVVRECLAEAMAQERGVDLHGRYGIRGGTTPVERRELSRALSQRPGATRGGSRKKTG